MALERREWGNFYGFLDTVKENGAVVASGTEAWSEFQTRLDAPWKIHKRIYNIEKHEIGSVNSRLSASA